MPLAQVDEYYAEARALPDLELVGLSTHIGSQITDTAPFTEAADKVAAIVKRLRESGIALSISISAAALASPTRKSRRRRRSTPPR